MTMCVIERFTINGQQVGFDKARTEATTLNPDRIAGYTLTDCALSMALLQPNEFTFSIRRNTITKSDETKHYTIVKHLIGQKVECQVSTYLDQQKTSTLLFKGTIAKVSMKGLNIECVANSEEADLQGTPKCRCFTEMKLEEIVNSLLPDSMAKKVVFHDYVKDLVFPYIVQYNENDYDFLTRLAQRFGAFFYFDQKQRLVFGKLPDNKPKEIQSKNVASVGYELQTVDPNFCYVSHYDQKNVDLESDGADPGMFNATKLFQTAIKASGSLDRSELLPIDEPNSLPKDPASSWMDDYNLMMLCGNSGETVTCHFISYLFDIEVGSIIKINDNGLMVVTSANITWDCNGSPENEITAMLLPGDSVDTDAILAPYMDYNAYPKSSAQRAVVINNVDPQKMGRVQVQFVWQEDPVNDQEKAKLPWIRIAQPYGGNQKGCFVLPEIGEEVMVGFEHENMEKPFVIGTLFHNSDEDDGKQMPDEQWVEAGDANKENEVKAFRTKKGHTIEFHDTKDGDGFIRIYGNEKKDQPNYDIILSTDPIKLGDKHDQEYQVKCADESSEAGKDVKEKEDYKASKLRIMVRSNGGDIVLDAGQGDILMNAANIRFHATGNATSLIEGKNVVKVKGDQLVDVGSSSVMVQKDQTIEIKGADKEKYDKGVTVEVAEAVKLKAKSLESKTDQDTVIQAANVKADSKQSTKVSAKTGLELDGGTESKLKASKVSVEGQVSAEVKASRVTAEGNVNTILKGVSVEIDAVNGTRKGLWQDQ